MKVALLSDIHGNIDALKAVLDQLPPVDALIAAGDVLGYYPFFEECIDALQELGAHCVCGNHEAYQRGLLPLPAKPVLHWFWQMFASQASKSARQWLEGLSTSLEVLFERERMMVCHGSPWSIAEYIHLDFLRWERFESVAADTIVLGHTHRPMKVRWGKKLLINPGSVGQPRDGDPRAAYAVYDDELKEVTFHRVAYDAEKLVETMMRLEQGEKYVRCFLQGERPARAGTWLRHYAHTKGNVYENRSGRPD